MTGTLDRQRLTVADLHERIRDAAFALLLAERRPIMPDEIAALAGAPVAGLGAMLDQLAGAGWIDRDGDGRVTGSAGLSLSTGPHRITIGGTEFRTWCAYDAIGIAAALGADAAIRTGCAVCGAEIALDTRAGQPPADRPEVLWLATGGTDLRGGNGLDAHGTIPPGSIRCPIAQTTESTKPWRTTTIMRRRHRATRARRRRITTAMPGTRWRCSATSSG